MKWLAKWMGFLVLALFTSAAVAQSPEPRARQPFSQAELDQMLAPIALYPDSLLSQILMAATYPREVAEAASWSRANSRLRGDDAVRAAQNEPWDPSVISITAFPQVLAMMGQRRTWTERLGEAYLEQPQQVMDTIQALRARADGAGNLRSSEEIIVRRQSDDYIIEAPTPEVVYVPYYDPRVAYGAWWWPDYQPVYWRPWPGYAYDPGYGGLGWGYGITIGSGFFFGAIDWPRRYLRYSHHRPWYFHGRDWRQGDRWSHNRDQRRDVRDFRGRDGDRNRWRDGGQNRVRDANRDRWREGDRDVRRGDRRPTSPAYQAEGAPRDRAQRQERFVREQPNAIVRPAEARALGAPRAAPVQRVPAPQPQVAPPVHQVAPAPQRQPAQHPASRAREERQAPESNPAARSSPSSAPSYRGGRTN